MTAASVFLHQQSPDGAKGEARTQEPSMEDILASIRRIIADDQLQSQRPGYGGPRRVGTAAPPVATSETPRSTRAAEARGYDDVLDLARMRGTAQPEREAPRPAAERRDPVTSFLPTPPEQAAVQPVAPAVSAWPVDHRQQVEPRYDEPATTEDDEVEAGETSFLEDTAYADIAPVGVDDSRMGRSLTTERLGPTPHAAPAVGGGDALISAKPGAAVMSAFETLAATVILQNGEMLDRIMRDELRPLIKAWLDDNLPTLVERLVRSEIERVARGGRS